MSRYVYTLLVLVALLIPSTRSTVQAAPAATPTVRRVIALINARRAAAGLYPVVLQGTLQAEAQRFSAVQASLGRITHRGTDGSTAGQRLTRAGYRWRFWGENLAAGQANADQVVAAWMASPIHRANILNPTAREIGIGHTVRSNDPAHYYDYWAMEAGRSR